MITSQVFHFVSYDYDRQTHEARLHYRFDEDPILTDTVTFNFEPMTGYDEAVLDRVLRGLWLMSGVSYLKAKLPSEIEVHGTQLSQAEADFFSQTYRLGLGQLCYESNVSLDRVARFGASLAAPLEPLAYRGEGSLLAFGGGKDSLVSAGLLKDEPRLATLSATYSPGAGRALALAAADLGVPHLSVTRTFDPALAGMSAQGFNGHVPVSAVIGFIGLAAAVLTGRKNFVFSNEASAGEGNVVYEGVEINHQYSKSLEYERAFAKYIASTISPDLMSFSLLRPLGELAIAELFVAQQWPRFKYQFSSCNRSFVSASAGYVWCGDCPKCAFVFLILAPFVPRDELVSVVGVDMFEQPGLEKVFGELLGLSGHKPFECVGEIEECQEALRMVQRGGGYPAASQWQVPNGHLAYREMHASLLDADKLALVRRALGALGLQA